MNDILFPHDEIRDIQHDLIAQISDALETGKSLIAHAPTGLGKTAAALAPALTYAIKHKKTVFFLTSRHTQHKIAIDTLKQIKKKHEADFSVCDIIGKKHMCLQPGVQTLYSGEFSEYCKNLREEEKCDFYNNTYSKSKKSELSVRGKKVLNDLSVRGTSDTHEVIEACRTENEELCPYEISQKLAAKASVIIADYFYIFDPFIQSAFFKRINLELEDCIIIVDEAHNLPERIRNLMSERLSIQRLDRAIKEAKKYKYDETTHILKEIKDKIFKISLDLSTNEPEKLIAKDLFIKKVNEIDDYDKIVEDLTFIGDEIRKDQKRSYIASIAELMTQWKGFMDKDSFLSKTAEEWEKAFICYTKKGFNEEDTAVCSRCLDPSVLTSDVMNSVHSVIMMSGTLNPTSMYRDLLGFKQSNVIEKEYESPFPEKNRLCMIIPETSTKYTARSEEQFKRIAEIASDAGNSIKGNLAIFFPSYFLLEQIGKYMKTLYEKTLFMENPKMSSEEKHSMIERFKGYKESGAGLLAVASGSYGEGIDLPGDFLKGVIIVGLPLQKPDLETKELINYYDAKFNKGWDYGYLFPAFNKTLQNAGRCIRSKDDKGVIIFLDERYGWSNYYRCFPKDMKLKVTKEYKAELVEFFW